ncbi:titin-like isoform X2 [Hypomesus transpacificus]|uniref:titin-like isoform X2 n=1 Tax=Hypomesus transpacificus TaxID=137520 RepID=UPI001F076DBB|nr:titin-like isoform X2 [Hypomesus transpacificus]
MGLTSPCVLLLLSALLISGNTQAATGDTDQEMEAAVNGSSGETTTAPPTATVNILSPPDPLYPGDTVTLQCDISQYEDWNYYFWYMNDQKYEDCTSKTCSIKLVHNNYQYSCAGRRSGRPQDSQRSAPSFITVTAVPKATLTVTPNPVYHGETVSLKCSVESGPAWSYRWYKDGTEIRVEQSGRHWISGDSLTISKVESSDQDQYWCTGEIQSRSISTLQSDSISITVKALPTATVNILSPPDPLYPGDTVTLQCDISQYEDWNDYFWYMNDQKYEDCTSKTCSIKLVHNNYQYSCAGRRSGRPQSSQRSAPSSITVTAVPKATLTVTPNPVYHGETVSLKCSVESGPAWSYRWYKDRPEIRVEQSGRHWISGDSLTISKVESSDQDQYWCTGEIPSRSISTLQSDSISITVKALPTATVNILSPPAPHYSGEVVSLQCDILENEDWSSYIWFINGQKYNGRTSKTCSFTLGHATVRYSCSGRRSGQSQTSQQSPDISITITALPTATVNILSPPAPLYPGDTVTLQCDISQYEDWNYYFWYMNGQYYKDFTSKTCSIKLDHNNVQYSCEGRRMRSGRPQDSQRSATSSIPVTALPKATLTVTNPVYHGETVSLKCSVESGPAWSYRWYKGRPEIRVEQSGRHWISGDSLTISKVESYDQGSYRCRGELRSLFSTDSDSTYLYVYALPTATVNILSPPAPHYPGDTVTLQCDISQYEDWNYYFWMINNNDYKDCTKKTCSIKLDQYGVQHSCRGRGSGRPQDSQFSAPSSIPVTALPKATLTVTPNPVYHGETVSLKCSVESGLAWSYRWYKDRTDIRVKQSGRHRISGDSLTISKVESSDQAHYWCTGVIPSRSISTVQSDSISMTVKDYVPTATLQSDKTDIYTGARVTLTCTVEGSSWWWFYWYRHTTDSDHVASSYWSPYSFTPASVSEGGQFWCRGERGYTDFYTQYSSPVHINVTARPYASVTLRPNWIQIFRGESVTLRCDIQGTEDTDWEYEWWRPGDSTPGWTEQEYKIISAEESYSGDYKCRGQRGKDHSVMSSAVKLTVKNRPQPVLRVSPSWLNPGDSVTLSCEVGDSSTGWSFSFYRAAPSLPDQPYSVELLSDREQTTGNSSTLQLAAPSHTAGYMCRAGRGETVYYSDYSNPQFHWSGDLHSSVSLSVSTNRSQQLVSESVSLSCELKGNSTGWTLRRYSGSELYTVCSSVSPSTCTIEPLNVEHSGVFWCESGSGEDSNAVNITVHVGSVILESPVHPVTEGDSVTLRCRHKTPPSSPEVDFYKDGNLIRKETTGEMTIPAVSQSDKGLYKCTYSDREESSQSWLLVRVPSSSVGLMVGLVVTGVLLFLLILMLLGWRKFKGAQSSGASISSQAQSTKRVLDGVQITNQNQAPGGNALLHHGQGVEAGPSHLTYAQIELKKMKKPKRKTGKQAESEEDTIYSNVATGPSSVGAGPSDLTYAKIELKKMKKPKRKTGKQAESEEDTIYSNAATGPSSDMLTTREPDAVCSAVKTG